MADDDKDGVERARPRDVTHIHAEIHAHVPPEPALRVKALESLLVEKGLLDSDAVDAWIELYQNDVGPKRGATVVARAWVDAAFKARLLEDAAVAVRDLGIDDWAPGHLQAVANTPAVHNLVVCTLCSCYPHSLLSLPPAWYKKAAYRSRAVRDPRGVLSDFGVSLPEDVRVTVWDSTSELRYFVIPERPEGTEGWPEEKLASVITRNSMIGTERELKLPAARV